MGLIVANECAQSHCPEKKKKENSRKCPCLLQGGKKQKEVYVFSKKKKKDLVYSIKLFIQVKKDGLSEIF